MSRIVSIAWVLALALLASCTIYIDDGDPPAPSPPLYNQPGDEYDAVNHRLLRGDCEARALTALDLATGQTSVLVDRWPWPDSDGACVETVVSQSDGRHVYAVTGRSFQDPSGSVSCGAKDLVAIDTATGQVDEIVNITRRCCDDCGDYHGYESLQVDLSHERLLYVEHDCDPNFCDSYVSVSDFGAMESTRIQSVFITDCSAYEDDQDCFENIDMIIPKAMSFDPAQPDSAVLLLLENQRTDAVTIETLDFISGARQQIAAVATVWGGLRITRAFDLAVDADEQRVFVSGSGVASNQTVQVVISVDLVTGEQRLLHDGSPTADGLAIACPPDAAYDARERRVLLVEPVGGLDCGGHVFAVDADTGALTLVSAGPGPAL